MRLGKSLVSSSKCTGKYPANDIENLGYRNNFLNRKRGRKEGRKEIIRRSRLLSNKFPRYRIDIENLGIIEIFRALINARKYSIRFVIGLLRVLKMEIRVEIFSFVGNIGKYFLDGS